MAAAGVAATGVAACGDSLARGGLVSGNEELTDTLLARIAGDEGVADARKFLPPHLAKQITKGLEGLGCWHKFDATMCSFCTQNPNAPKSLDY